MNGTHDISEQAGRPLPRLAVPPPRLYAVLAQKAPVGVIFRRGPSRWVRIIKWHTDNDTFEPGHWFHGRIYERQSDVSPDGSKLIYFALKIKPGRELGGKPQVAWTAISRPPWLTALALWPKQDTWGGGGLFIDEHTIWLNHLPEDAQAEEHHQPQGIDVTLDYKKICDQLVPIYLEWFDRHGWRASAIGTAGPVVLTKACPRAEQSLVYAWGIPATRQEVADLVRVEYTLTTTEGVTTKVAAGPQGSVWADWDQQGRLVFAKLGRLFAGELSESGALTATELADFNDAKPEAIKPPDWATKW